MTEPRDDWDTGSSQLAKELLGAGRRERASERAQDRATQVLLASMTASSAAAANAGTWITTLKWLGISVALLGAGAGLWRMSAQEPRQGERPAQVSHRPAPATHDAMLADNAPDASAGVATTSSAARITSALSTRRPTPSVAPSAPAPTPAPAPSADVRGARDTCLAQELLAVSRARAAIAAGAPAQALATLDSVADGDGFQQLPLEADLVRIEALRVSGKVEAARALSEHLLHAHPDGPYTERLRALTATLGSSAQPLPSVTAVP